MYCLSDAALAGSCYSYLSGLMYVGDVALLKNFSYISMKMGIEHRARYSDTPNTISG